jgi:hypothetical protein
MKKCSTSLAMQEMQIKTMLRFHLTQVRMAILGTPATAIVGKDEGEKRTLLRYWWECKLEQPPWKAEWKFLKKLKQIYHTIQQYHSWAYTQRNVTLDTIETLAHRIEYLHTHVY